MISCETTRFLFLFFRYVLLSPSGSDDPVFVSAALYATVSDMVVGLYVQVESYKIAETGY